MRRGYRRSAGSVAGAPQAGGFAAFFVLCGACLALTPFLGEDFFPQVDAGQIRLHVRAPAGTRIEETEALFRAVENTIRHVIPPAELADVLDNIGLPYSGVNIAMSDTADHRTFRWRDSGVVEDRASAGPPGTTFANCAAASIANFPGLTFFFQPADIVGQILNFGLPAPIDIQIMGPLPNAQANYAIARQIERRLARIPGAVDVHTHQVVDVPELLFQVDRTRAGSWASRSRTWPTAC